MTATLSPGRRAARIAVGTVAANVAGAARRSASWTVNRFDLLGDATAAIETMSALDSYSPSLMPRTSVHQGLASGLHVTGARLIGGRIDALLLTIVGAGAGAPTRLVARGVSFAVGHAATRLPESPDETLWRSGARTGGDVVRAVAVSGAVFDVAKILGQRGRRRQLALVGLAATGGAIVWGTRRLRHRREVIPRWPVEQKADILPSIGVGIVVSTAGTALGAAYRLSGDLLVRYFGDDWSRAGLARTANAGLWAWLATVGYNTGTAYVGRANEKVEAAYSTPPESPLVSGSPTSVSDFSELGLQGRRFVTDVTDEATIERVMGEPAVAHPIRTYVGFNSMPLYQTGRAELALEELERTGAFDRSYLLLVSPTGTGWVDQTMVESAEFLTRGDIATCSVQYGRFPSFLAVQKVGLGRGQFRLLLWGIKQRLAERPPERRPKVLIFGESLGAWTASDVVMAQGIRGFDHYGIDRALWVGLPALAKWSRNGMATGSNDLVPDGTVRVFDNHDELAALDQSERDRLRAVILSHDNDPIAALRPELMIRRPEWLRDDRGRNVPDDMDWVPINTFWQVLIDAANAMVTVPGHFGSFGHDYRADMTRFVRDAYNLPATTEEQAVRIDDALKATEIERGERISAGADDDVDIEWSVEVGERRFAGGVPLGVERTRGARWFR